MTCEKTELSVTDDKKPLSLKKSVVNNLFISSVQILTPYLHFNTTTLFK